MLYTDFGWKLATGQAAPPVDNDTSKNSLEPKFRGFFDGVGYWADWYSKERLLYRFGDFLDLVFFDYLMPGKAYAAAILRPKK